LLVLVAALWPVPPSPEQPPVQPVGGAEVAPVPEPACSGECFDYWQGVGHARSLGFDQPDECEEEGADGAPDFLRGCRDWVEWARWEMLLEQAALLVG